MKRVRFRDPSGSVRTGQWLDETGAPASTAGDGGIVTFADSEYDPSEVEILPPTIKSRLYRSKLRRPRR
jgi:hypothetical protein